MSDSLTEFLNQVNDTQSDYPRDKALHQLVSEQATETPDRIVFESGDEQLTYSQLDEASNRLANHLIASGVEPGMLVGLCCERNLDTAVALIGIMKSGAGYVPLDPDYPGDRLIYMSEDSGLYCVLAHESLAELVDTFCKPAIYVDKNREEIESRSAANPNIPIETATHIAYVIYTSGSTGKPKGVLVPHRGVVNLLWGLRTQGTLTADDVMLGLTTLSFDISVIEMFAPMVVGGKTAIIDRRTAKDGQLLVDAINKHKPTFMQATPSTWRFLIDAGWQGQTGTRFQIASGGEPLPRDLVQPLLDRSDALWNWYGPTETTVWSTRYLVTNSNDKVLIGRAWENTTLYIVDDNDQLLGVGEEGELLIGGDGVTRGYLNRDELTSQRFIDFNGERVYRTGDLAKFMPDATVECLGRIDSQVKLHGYRIELEEIDTMLSTHPTVHRAATAVREDVPGDKRLVGYLKPAADQVVDIADVRRLVSEKLPEYMVPGALVIVDSFPQTPSGKLDRKALPKPSLTRPDLCPFVAPSSEQEQQLAEMWTDILQLDRVGVNDNFFQIGGSSILALKAISRMQTEMGLSLNAPEMFDNPTVSQLLAYVEQKSQRLDLLGKKRSSKSGSASSEFAIVGMAARFPGAKDVVEYWQNICEGKESITFFTPEELDPTLPENQTSDASYVAARGIVDDADKFDAQFFGMNPREAQYIDPQQRVMLEVAWSALEDAHCVPDTYAGTIGVWAGTYTNTYFTKNILTNPELIELTGEFQMVVYNEKDYIATRLAHKLNLTGPAVNVNTACSTSLVAVIEACNSLALGHCDVALAGGASITFPQNSGHLHQEGSIMSPDGHCRPFDAQSAGTLFSDGVGMVVVKRLEDAIVDGDRIYAVIKGCGINNDGGEKASFTAPSIQGQASAIAMAQAHADVDIETIEYVEAHGTATPIGDPIEVQALTSVFEAQTDKKQFCAIGSVKSNIGHTVAAAGAAGLIKCALSLHHEQIPGTLHYEKANPQIDFENSPFFVCDELTEWKRKETPRRSAVSSFGVGGTNAHVLLEEAPNSRLSLRESSECGTSSCGEAEKSSSIPSTNESARSRSERPRNFRGAKDDATSPSLREGRSLSDGEGEAESEVAFSSTSDATCDVTSNAASHSTSDAIVTFASPSPALKGRLSRRESEGPRGEVQLIPFSAKSPEARDAYADALKQHVTSTADAIDDIAFTLQTTRAEFPHRGFAIASTNQQLTEVLEKQNPPTFATSQFDGTSRDVVFMFPGQGSQYVWMGKNLYDGSSVFRQAMDECCDILAPLLGRDLRDVLYPTSGSDEEAAKILRETQFTQPAIFCVGYSLAKLWQSWGVEPKVLLGHSIGEFVAACLANVFSLEDGLKLIAERGRLMQELPGGSMLSVRAPAENVLPELEKMNCDQLAIASYNGPKLCVVAGPDDVVEQLRQRLDSQDIVCKELHTSHAFHSPMMDDIVEPFREFVSQIELRAPTKPIMSTVSADWMTDEQATDPAYWARHMRAPVAFSQAVEQVWKDEPTRVLVELGPRRTLATLAKQHATDKQTQRSIASLTDNAEDNAEWVAILGAVGQLWMLGQSIDWVSLHEGEQRNKVSLPTYQFQRESYFVEPKLPYAYGTQIHPPTGRVGLSGPGRENSVGGESGQAAPNQTAPNQTAFANQQSTTGAPSPLVPRDPPGGRVNAQFVVPPLGGTADTGQPPEGGTTNNSTQPTAVQPTTTTITREQKVTATRLDQIREAVEEILENTSGIELDEFESDMTFFEMGMDSLVLTQTAAAIKRDLGVNISFRQMLEETPTIASFGRLSWTASCHADKFARPVVEEVEVEVEAAVRARQLLHRSPLNWRCRLNR